MLFSANDIATGRRLQSLHEHNEAAQSEEIVARVRSGELVVPISDAGTPGISDPGARAVAAVIAAGLRVSTAPGPSAVVAALSISGLSSERFVMEGFLPRSRANANRSYMGSGRTRSEPSCMSPAASRLGTARTGVDLSRAPRGGGPRTDETARGVNRGTLLRQKRRRRSSPRETSWERSWSSWRERPPKRRLRTTSCSRLCTASSGTTGHHARRRRQYVARDAGNSRRTPYQLALDARKDK